MIIYDSGFWLSAATYSFQVREMLDPEKKQNFIEFYLYSWEKSFVIHFHLQ
jgi:hypothetical protein